MPSGVFDRLAGKYDAWFDTPRGRAIFRAEVECLERLLPARRAGWVEVGVGSGRFAAALGIREGVDPSEAMLRLAAARGIATRKARAEELPYPACSLDGILLVVTLCFLDAPEAAFHECARVLRAAGRVLAGIVPADSPWGRFYREKAARDHPFYSVARFYTCRQLQDLAAGAGFELEGAASTLPMGPDEPLEHIPTLRGAREECGFVAMLFRLARRQPLRERLQPSGANGFEPAGNGSR